MDIAELKALTPKELERLLAETREKLRAARFLVHEGAEKKVRTVRELRRTIARALTVLSEKK